MLTVLTHTHSFGDTYKSPYKYWIGGLTGYCIGSKLFGYMNKKTQFVGGSVCMLISTGKAL